jgi:hypothetical protein
VVAGWAGFVMTGAGGAAGAGGGRALGFTCPKMLTAGIGAAIGVGRFRPKMSTFGLGAKCCGTRIGASKWSKAMISTSSDSGQALSSCLPVMDVLVVETSDPRSSGSTLALRVSSLSEVEMVQSLHRWLVYFVQT